MEGRKERGGGAKSVWKNGLVGGGFGHVKASWPLAHYIFRVRVFLHLLLQVPAATRDSNRQTEDARLLARLQVIGLRILVVDMAKLDVDIDASCIITHAYQPCLLQYSEV